MTQLKDLLETMDAELLPFESWLLTERRGDFSYTRHMPEYEPPKAAVKPKPQSVFDDDFRGFPRF